MNTIMNKTKELQNLSAKRKARTKCSKCKSSFYIENSNEIEKYDGFCYNCRKEKELFEIIPNCKFCNSEKVIKQGFKKIKNKFVQNYKCRSCGKKFRGEISSNNEIDISIKELDYEDILTFNIRNSFEKLKEGHSIVQDNYNRLFDYMNEKYGNDTDWFSDFIYMNCDFVDYFDRLDIEPSFDDFKKWMEDFEKLRDRKRFVCKKCSVTINMDSPWVNPRDYERHEGMCNSCWNVEYKRRMARLKKDKK